MQGNTEVPFQTYERLTQRPWPGGRSGEIIALLYLFGIEAAPGTAEANLALQDQLLRIEQDRQPRSVIVTEEKGVLRMSHHPFLTVSEIIGMLEWALDVYKSSQRPNAAAGLPPDLMAVILGNMMKGGRPNVQGEGSGPQLVERSGQGEKGSGPSAG